MMDTTATYIRMRLAAIPDLGYGKVPGATQPCVPSGWVNSIGDFYTHINEEPYYCQLERQDQLQEMVDNKPEELIDGMNGFLEWIDFTIYNEYAKQFTSMEQLWLAFVMKEKYNKVWDGKSWS